MPRGGYRPGAGRPRKDARLKKVPVGVRLPAWLVDWMREQDRSYADLIEEAIREKHGIDPPKA